MNKRVCKTLIVALCMLLLILDTKTAVNGAIRGIDLCIRVLFPSLFPFLLISVALTDLLSGKSSIILRPLGRIMKIPAGSESLFLVGMLGGYPVGAQIISHSAEKGILCKNDARRMMQFCNNAGPAFLFGVISPQFPNRSYTWLIWSIILLSSIITAMILPGGNNSEISIPAKKSMTLTQAMEKSIKVMSGICGWVVIFRVILAFLERWFLWLLPDVLRIAAQMLLELANGCIVLNEIENIGLRFILTVAGLSIGGFCVLLQTMSVSGTLGVAKYMHGKLLQTVIGVLLAIPVVFFLKNGVSPTIPIGIILSSFLILVILSDYRKKHKNKYRIPLHGSV